MFLRQLGFARVFRLVVSKLRRFKTNASQNREISANGSKPRRTCIFPYSAQRASEGITLPGLSSSRAGASLQLQKSTKGASRIHSCEFTLTTVVYSVPLTTKRTLVSG
jgi:hypothetical protein